jgi:hypothetical protein
MPDKPVPIVNAFGLTAVIVPDAPNATVTPLYVTELFVNALLGMLVNVFLMHPDIDLFVNVSVPANVANVPVVGRVTPVVPVKVIVRS